MGRDEFRAMMWGFPVWVVRELAGRSAQTAMTIASGAQTPASEGGASVNSATITGVLSFRILDDVALVLYENADLRVRIEGHTDNTGNESKNRELSRRRAESVKRYLVQRGVPPDRLITVGMASSQPVKSNKSQAGRKANRRYQFQLLED